MIESIMRKATILGAIAGDTIMTYFPASNDSNFSKFSDRMKPEGASIMTCAVAEWLLSDPVHRPEALVQIIRKWGRKYDARFHNVAFMSWAKHREDYPYRYNYPGEVFNSIERVTPIGFAFNTLEETLRVAEVSAMAGVNDPIVIQEVKAVATTIFMARTGASKRKIKRYLSRKFGDEFDCEYETLSWMRGGFKYMASAAPSALIKSEDYRDALKLVSLGSWTRPHTIGCITGGMAISYYKEMPSDIYDFVWDKMGEDMKEVVRMFDEKYA